MHLSVRCVITEKIQVNKTNLCVVDRVNSNLVTHGLWILRLLQEGRELQHSQLRAGNASALPRGGTGRHGQPCCAFITCKREGSECVNVWFECDEDELENAATLQLFL